MNIADANRAAASRIQQDMRVAVARLRDRGELDDEWLDDEDE